LKPNCVMIARMRIGKGFDGFSRQQWHSHAILAKLPGPRRRSKRLAATR
jgi:hypothetical protein